MQMDILLFIHMILLSMKINDSIKTQNLLEWDYTSTNNTWQGWDHQTSKITLKLTAKLI